MINTIKRFVFGKRDGRIEECSLILNALELLRAQRAVAVELFGENDPHLAELDAEETSYRARLDEIGGMIAQ